MLSRALPLLALVSVGAVAVAEAQPLPQGVIRKGDVITMQPVAESDSVQPAAAAESERRDAAVKVLSPADHDLFTRAFDAADRGDWPTALGLARQGHNATAKQIIQWRYLQDKNAKAPFADIDAFLSANSDWPRRNILFVRAEEQLDPATPPEKIIAWFGNRNPISAIGMIRLGEALVATGKTTAGQRLIRDGWVAGVFDPDVELAIVQKDGAYLTPDIDKKRLDNLVWSDSISAARREMARVDDASQKIANARIALRADPKRGQRTVAELPSDLASDPQLWFDEARAARKTQDFDRAAELLQRPQLRELFKTRPGPLWAETHIIAREMMKEAKNEVALHLVSETGLSSGSEFSDAEFLSGWIALRFMKDATSALPHFLRLADGVSRPISKARAYYWQGRTYEELNKPDKAYTAYQLAAANPETFYGQLALTRIEEDPKLHLPSPKAEAAPATAAFERDDLVKAMRVLGDLGAQNYLRAFAARYQELHPSHAKKLMQMLTDMGYRDVALRVAKAVGYEGPTYAAYAYPVIPVPEYRGNGIAPEPALVHAIIRQETEFDPQSVSAANARGIMQLTLASAKVNAKRAGLPYRPGALTTDVTYNMQLGMTEFSAYLANWNNSVILSAAAYNAGESNAKRWVQVFGDPRSAATDPVDWIESITYGETRNYVMRIVENLQVYRNRIAGKDTPLRILADLYTPSMPPQAKVLRPPVTEQPAPAEKKKKRTSSN
ncbi:soluble lytic murein transglycosylase [Rhizomicrobium palustre]|uniref:Soluble lytic murein transglycosylase n=1 Tax=Rhizomicrobium palustre TaxID=189966 RepID=A0A846N3N7_9PROT|nr:lytic transglycosylase domain-containing protein [Rhizomicrobium palustre]NIK90346.1 soluble lytic murein transglycosylase [Rhizomicrobium palustre]